MQAQADLARIPVEVYPSAHATPLGAAACARLALDPALSLAEVVGELDARSTPTNPLWSADRAAEHLQRWQHAADAALAPKETHS